MKKQIIIVIINRFTRGMTGARDNITSALG